MTSLRIGPGRWVGLLIGLALTSGCGSDRFACGDGECAIGTEVCVIGGPDRCSTCVPAPAECTSCDCLPPATDEAFGAFRCLDQGACDEIDDGAVVTCEEVEWGCG